MYSLGYRKQLDLFTLPLLDGSFKASEYTPYYPTVSPDNVVAPVEFQINGTPHCYLDLFTSFLYVKAKINEIGSDGKKTPVQLQDSSDPPKKILSTVNNFLHSMFDLVEIYMNGKLLSSKEHYNYLSMLLSMTSYSPNYQSMALKSALFTQSFNIDKMDSTDTGFSDRAKEIEKRNPIELTGRLFHDFFLQEKYLLPNISLKIRLRRTSPEYCLLSTDKSKKYSIDFENVIFYCKRIVMQESILHSQMQTLNQKGSAAYPFLETKIRAIPVAKNTNNLVLENIFPVNELPSKVLLAMISTDAFNGSTSLSPYNFKSNNLSCITLTVNNDESRRQQINYDFDKEIFMVGYQQFIDALNMSESNFTYNSWIKEKFIQIFDVAQSINLTSGTLKIELVFKKALEEAMMLLVLSQRNSILEIGRDGTASINGGEGPIM